MVMAESSTQSFWIDLTWKTQVKYKNSIQIHLQDLLHVHLVYRLLPWRSQHIYGLWRIKRRRKPAIWRCEPFFFFSVFFSLTINRFNVFLCSHWEINTKCTTIRNECLKASALVWIFIWIQDLYCKTFLGVERWRYECVVRNLTCHDLTWKCFLFNIKIVAEIYKQPSSV